MDGLPRAYAVQYFSVALNRWVQEDLRCASTVAMIANYVAKPGTWMDVMPLAGKIWSEKFQEHLDVCR